MQQQSKDAYPDGNSVPTLDPCQMLDQVRSLEPLAHKDHHSISMNQRKQLPGQSATLGFPLTDRPIFEVPWIMGPERRFFP